jgi:hypothetical protein
MLMHDTRDVKTALRVRLFFGFITLKAGSMISVSLSHGITNARVGGVREILTVERGRDFDKRANLKCY